MFIAVFLDGFELSGASLVANYPLAIRVFHRLEIFGLPVTGDAGLISGEAVNVWRFGAWEQRVCHE
jgi:hypothetical protein